MKKLVSRFARLFVETPLDTVKVLERPSFVRSSKVVDGRVVGTLDKQLVHPGKQLSQFKASDYSLENLLAIGDERHLQPLHYSSSPTEVAESFAKVPESALFAAKPSSPVQPTESTSES